MRNNINNRNPNTAAAAPLANNIYGTGQGENQFNTQAFVPAVTNFDDDDMNMYFNDLDDEVGQQFGDEELLDMEVLDEIYQQEADSHLESFGGNGNNNTNHQQQQLGAGGGGALSQQVIDIL